jgi:hypothetical protein
MQYFYKAIVFWRGRIKEDEVHDTENLWWWLTVMHGICKMNLKHTGFFLLILVVIFHPQLNTNIPKRQEYNDDLYMGFRQV